MGKRRQRCPVKVYKKRKKENSCEDKFLWSYLPGGGDIMWPVRIINADGQDTTDVYCRADCAEFTVKNTRICPYKEFRTQMKERGQAKLRRKKRTLEAFISDCDWADDGEYQHETDEGLQHEEIEPQQHSKEQVSQEPQTVLQYPVHEQSTCETPSPETIHQLTVNEQSTCKTPEHKTIHQLTVNEQSTCKTPEHKTLYQHPVHEQSTCETYEPQTLHQHPVHEQSTCETHERQTLYQDPVDEQSTCETHERQTLYQQPVDEQSTCETSLPENVHQQPVDEQTTSMTTKPQTLHQQAVDEQTTCEPFLPETIHQHPVDEQSTCETSLPETLHQRPEDELSTCETSLPETLHQQPVDEKYECETSLPETLHQQAVDEQSTCETSLPETLHQHPVDEQSTCKTPEPQTILQHPMHEQSTCMIYEPQTIHQHSMDEQSTCETPEQQTILQHPVNEQSTCETPEPQTLHQHPVDEQSTCETSLPETSHQHTVNEQSTCETSGPQTLHHHPVDEQSTCETTEPQTLQQHPVDGQSTRKTPKQHILHQHLVDDQSTCETLESQTVLQHPVDEPSTCETSEHETLHQHPMHEQSTCETSLPETLTQQPLDEQSTCMTTKPQTLHQHPVDEQSTCQTSLPETKHQHPVYEQSACMTTQPQTIHQHPVHEQSTCETSLPETLHQHPVDEQSTCETSLPETIHQHPVYEQCTCETLKLQTLHQHPVDEQYACETTKASGPQAIHQYPVYEQPVGEAPEPRAIQQELSHRLVAEPHIQVPYSILLQQQSEQPCSHEHGQGCSQQPFFGQKQVPNPVLPMQHRSLTECEARAQAQHSWLDTGIESITPLQNITTLGDQCHPGAKIFPEELYTRNQQQAQTQYHHQLSGIQSQQYQQTTDPHGQQDRSQAQWLQPNLTFQANSQHLHSEPVNEVASFQQTTEHHQPQERMETLQLPESGLQLRNSDPSEAHHSDDEEENEPDILRLKGCLRDVKIPTYAKHDDGGRNYVKHDYCLFCNRRFSSSIAKHYMNMHGEQAEVKLILQLSIGSKKRKDAWTRLRNEGNYKHNTKVLREGRGELVILRRPNEESKKHKPWQFVPCEYCYGFLMQKSLCNHMRTCSLKPSDQQPSPNFLRNAKMMLSPFLADRGDEDQNRLRDLFNQMRDSKKNPGVAKVCCDDALIREFALSLLDKLGSAEEQRCKDMANVRNKVRTLGRLKQKLNEKESTDKQLSNFLCGRHFRLVVKCTKELSKDADSPQLALVLGHYVKQANLIKISLGIEQENNEMKQEGEAFKSLYECHWNCKVSSVANRRQKLRQINKPVLTPLTKDLTTLKNWLVAEIEKHMEENQPNYLEWKEVAQKLMVRTILFNKRRVAEVEEIKISDFEKRPSAVDNEEILASLEVTERVLASRTELIEVRGKSTRGIRKVYVVLTPDMVRGYKYLIRTRHHVSKYLFARGNDSPLDGCMAMRIVTEACPGLKNPQAIRSRSLRKYMATTVQVLDMNQSELQMIADHLGHDLHIHTNVYRLQSNLVERSKVAKILHAVDSGAVSKFKGKSMDTIETDDLPVPLDYFDDWETEQRETSKDAEHDHNVKDTADVQVPLDYSDDSETEQSETSKDVEYDHNVKDTAAIDSCTPSNSDGTSVTTIVIGDIVEDIGLFKNNHTLSDDTESDHPRNDDKVAACSSLNLGQASNIRNAKGKKKWTSSENAALARCFASQLRAKSTITAKDIREAKEKHECLQYRSEAVIRVKLNNIMKGKDKFNILL